MSCTPENTWSDYLFLDTEAGGLDPRKHSLLSLGLVVGGPQGVRHSLEILIKHDPYVVTEGGMAVNRINLEKHTAMGLAPEQALVVLDIFLAQHFPHACRPITLVGHNVSFDRDYLGVFLDSQGRLLEPRFGHRVIDTHSIAAGLRDAGRLDLPHLGSSALFEHFGIVVPDEKRHTALGDALATFELYWKLVEHMR
ncbi:3'-5' exonuclease [Holophaga foetida]|uniref:3'-5' exonuclease n=1 Tax=Holophaga foetida TaxID=35839 RepID=UPI0002472A7E|nr:3'-5' exonuclease [Holophaga foetida]